MKRFFISVLCVTVSCIGLGALVQKAGARFKSDERALALIKQARIAIGGEQSIADVRSMVIKGNTSITFKLKDGARTEAGETEIAMQLPDKFSKMVKIGRHDGAEGDSKVVSDVVIVRRGGEGHGEAVAGAPGEKTIIIKKVGENGDNVEIEKVTSDDGELSTSDGKKVILRTKTEGDVENAVVIGDGEQRRHVMLERTGGPGEMGGHRQNELLRTSLSLLLTAPEGIDVSYTFVGEGDVDSTPCNIVNAEFAGSNFKLYLSKASSLPVMISYSGHAMGNVMFFRTKDPVAGGEPAKADMVFTRKVDAPETTEVQIRFGDYRGVNGVQLPYRWTTLVGGQTTEVFEVTGYDVNPANIADKFQNQKVLVKTDKETN